ncbi:hypothetical protein SDC9_136939 [bioreactor metagenome]|uniref:Uncharacterized protein n=1 Tax=bioreactor metagenome TaxID=1076179 RepID=A0A645DK51_9ZZZZ
MRSSVFDESAGDKGSVAEDGITIRNLKNLRHFMRYKDKGMTLCFQFSEDAEEMFDLLCAQRGSRLVQNQQLCACVQRTADLEKLLLARLEFGYHGAGVDVYSQAREKLACLLDHALAVEQTHFRLELAI